MSDYLFLMESRFSPQQWHAVGLVEKAAATVGLNIYLAGGALRDLIAGLPIDDLDFVVEGKPAKLAKELIKKGASIIAENATRQSVELELPGGVIASISMAQVESRSNSGALTISPAPIVTDLKQRDFAMNAIAVSFTPNSRGLLLDPTNGVADVEKREIRSLSTYCFLDDPVRLIRAVRFRVRLGFAMDSRTATQYQNAMESDALKSASGESLAQEIRHWAREPQPVELLKALDKEKLLSAISPKLRGTSLDWTLIAKINKAALTLSFLGMRTPSFPLFLRILTRKLSSTERAALQKRLLLKASEASQPDKTEAAAKKLAKELGGAHGNTATKAFHLLSQATADQLLILLAGYPAATPAKIQSRLKNYLEKHLPLRSQLPVSDIIAKGVSADSPRLQKILDAYFFALIEGELRTPLQQQKHLDKLIQQTK
jgi:tRNA nucleotidyltransferase (CCA-adding enzyme)